jgi:antitoxin CptB
MVDPARLSRLRFRAWHRGTREADYIMGCFFDRHHDLWGEHELAWFEALLQEEDPDVLDWVLGAAPVPARYAGPQMTALQKLDFVEVSR